MIGPYYITSDDRRRAAWGDPCRTEAYSGRVVIDGRIFALSIHAVEAFAVFEKIRERHNYQLTGTDTGFYNCRHTQHNPSLPMSFHSWGMALDINWLENPAGSKLVTDLPRAMIRELLEVRTKSGARVFRWGGDWDYDGEWEDHSYVDAMHWEVVSHPLDLATGVVDPNEVEEIPVVPMPDFAKPSIDRLVKRKYLTVIPDEAPYSVWQTWVALDRMDAAIRKAIAAGSVTAAAVIAEIVNRLAT